MSIFQPLEEGLFLLLLPLGRMDGACSGPACIIGFLNICPAYLFFHFIVEKYLL